MSTADSRPTQVEAQSIQDIFLILSSKAKIHYTEYTHFCSLDKSKPVAESHSPSAYFGKSEFSQKNA